MPLWCACAATLGPNGGQTDAKDLQNDVPVASKSSLRRQLSEKRRNIRFAHYLLYFSHIGRLRKSMFSALWGALARDFPEFFSNSLPESSQTRPWNDFGRPCDPIGPHMVACSLQNASQNNPKNETWGQMVPQRVPRVPPTLKISQKYTQTATMSTHSQHPGRVMLHVLNDSLVSFPDTRCRKHYSNYTHMPRMG